MNVVVISDTHASSFDELPKEIKIAINKADFIIHLGDYESIEFVESLISLDNFYGVRGNHDNGKIKNLLPESDIVTINNKRIGLVHGHGCLLPLGLQYGLIQKFNDEKLDAILFGHTHIAVSKEIDGTLFFNPGSVAGRFPADQRSFGILEINSKIESFIVPLKTQYKNTIIKQVKGLIQELSPRDIYYKVTTLY